MAELFPTNFPSARRVAILTALIAALIAFTGCSTPLPLINNTPAATEMPEVTHTSQPTESAPPSSETTPSPAGPGTLRIWLPPEFDPQGENPAAELLKERLEAFAQKRPGVRVDVRIKALSGAGGLLDALTTASAAAPLALPDLVALPKEMMESAAIKGLLHPYDEHKDVFIGPDWYSYATTLARLQNSTFGLPFAGDILVMVYRPAVIENPPADWDALLETSRPLVFPAADQQALFTLAQYLAMGGSILNEEGKPILDLVPLTEVLEFYRSAEQQEVFPFWTSQYQGSEDVWEAFLERRADMAIVWASQYLREKPNGVQVAPLPSPPETSYTLAKSWVWALTTSTDENRPLSVELAEFLTEEEFLAAWTQAAGYLPPKSSSLMLWAEDINPSTFDLISQSAHSIPSPDLLSALGEVLQQAVIQVLKEQVDPVTASRQAINSLTSP